MRATVTLEKDLLDELLRASGRRSKAAAVRDAAAEYLRRRRIDSLRKLKGRLRFDVDADELRHRER
jgi:metal-responsive CopG/Arc/MetJ family transcriptional regulator